MVHVNYEITKEEYEKGKKNPYDLIGTEIKMGYGCYGAEVTEIDGKYYLSYDRGNSCG